MKDGARGHTAGRGQRWVRSWSLPESGAYSHSPHCGRKDQTLEGQKHQQKDVAASTNVWASDLSRGCLHSPPRSLSGASAGRDGSCHTARCGQPGKYHVGVESQLPWLLGRGADACGCRPVSWSLPTGPPRSRPCWKGYWHSILVGRGTSRCSRS